MKINFTKRYLRLNILFISYIAYQKDKNLSSVLELIVYNLPVFISGYFWKSKEIFFYYSFTSIDSTKNQEHM